MCLQFVTFRELISTKVGSFKERTAQETILQCIYFYIIKIKYIRYTKKQPSNSLIF